jgi:hypothetical protein
MKIWIAFLRSLTIIFLCSNVVQPTFAQVKDSLQKAGISPKKIMFQSMMLPGLGQVRNKQAWKVPVIYAVLGGLIIYNRRLDQSYRDYRAAFYNIEYPGGDQRFGPTPGYLSGVTSRSQLRYARDSYRNQRDQTYIYITLAYGFNALDAYIWAHLRMFDVSDNLAFAPTTLHTPEGMFTGVRLQLKFGS